MFYQEKTQEKNEFVNMTTRSLRSDKEIHIFQILLNVKKQEVYTSMSLN